MLRTGPSGHYNIGIYVRESRDDGGENYETLETQRDLLVDFVQKSGLGKVVGIYMDDNVSGSAFEREGLSRLKEDAAEGRLDLLLVKDLSRLGRNNAKTLLLLDYLEEYGVRVYSFDGRYDSVRDNDTVGIETWFNERYIRDISRKIRASLRYKIEKGEYLGHAPFGYKKSVEEKNRLCVDEEKAGIVRLIYKLYREGYGYGSIAKRLNDSGFDSPSQKAAWNPIAVRRILQSQVYTGDTVQGVSEKISFKSKKTRRLPRERWTVTSRTHEAIIDRAQFEEVQQLIRGRSQGYGPHKNRLYPLKGLIFCGRCGSILYARNRNGRKAAYICSRYFKTGTRGCSSHHVLEDSILQAVQDELVRLLNLPGIPEQAVELLLSGKPADGSDGNRRRRLESQLQNRYRQQEQLYIDRLEGRISVELFERMNRNLEGRIRTLTEEMEQIVQEEGTGPDIGSILSEVVHQLQDGWMTQEIVRTAVARVTVYDPGDEIPEEIRRKNREESAGEAEGLVVIDFRMKKV